MLLFRFRLYVHYSLIRVVFRIFYIDLQKLIISSKGLDKQNFHLTCASHEWMEMTFKTKIKMCLLLYREKSGPPRSSEQGPLISLCLPVMRTSPVMCGGQLAWGTLQVLLEAEVKGLAYGTDNVLGQTIRTLQDVTCWPGAKQHVPVSMFYARHEKTPWSSKPTSSVNRVLCYIGNIICRVLERDTFYNCYNNIQQENTSLIHVVYYCNSVITLLICWSLTQEVIVEIYT